MRRYSRLVTAFAALATVAIVAPAHAQEDVHLIARVPFAFTVGVANLPSDTYHLSRMNGHRELPVLRGDFCKREHSCVSTKRFCLAPIDQHPLCSTVTEVMDTSCGRSNGKIRRASDLPESKGERKTAESRVDRAGAGMDTVIVAADQR